MLVLLKYYKLDEILNKFLIHHCQSNFFYQEENLISRLNNFSVFLADLSQFIYLLYLIIVYLYQSNH